MTYTDQPNYTPKAAAHRTEQNVRTIKRWIENGLVHRVVAGRIVIDHDDLMTFWRAQMVRGTRRKMVQ